jgi:hypothetical protein
MPASNANAIRLPPNIPRVLLPVAMSFIFKFSQEWIGKPIAQSFHFDGHLVNLTGEAVVAFIIVL